MKREGFLCAPHFGLVGREMRCRWLPEIYASPPESIALFFFCERCSLDSRTGFEVFVPGRQSMASAMNPGFRSAYLIRRTVSHLFR
jgi:hypothetical protein